MNAKAHRILHNAQEDTTFEKFADFFVKISRFFEKQTPNANWAKVKETC